MTVAGSCFGSPTSTHLVHASCRGTKVAGCVACIAMPMIKHTKQVVILHRGINAHTPHTYLSSFVNNHTSKSRFKHSHHLLIMLQIGACTISHHPSAAPDNVYHKVWHEHSWVCDICIGSIHLSQLQQACRPQRRHLGALQLLHHGAVVLCAL